MNKEIYTLYLNNMRLLISSFIVVIEVENMHMLFCFWLAAEK